MQSTTSVSNPNKFKLKFFKRKKKSNIDKSIKSISMLPEDILKLIVGHLKISNLGGFASTNKFYAHMVTESEKWKSLAEQLFPSALDKHLQKDKAYYRLVVRINLWRLSKEENLCLLFVEKYPPFIMAKSFPKNFRTAYEQMRLGKPNDFIPIEHPFIVKPTNKNLPILIQQNNVYQFLLNCFEKDGVAQSIIDTFNTRFKYHGFKLGVDQTADDMISGPEISISLTRMLERAKAQMQECSSMII